MKLKVNPLIAVLAALVLVVALVVAFWPESEKRTVTAEFPRTVSLFEGSDVKIAGVAVGEVDEVKPAGTKVVVKFHYDAKYKVPRDAKAVVISPSIVGDRFVQLTPTYTSGPTMADGTRLGLDRTATPLELDEIFGSINDLDIALGPKGANRPDETGEGALTRLLDSTARNFGGEGVQFNKTLKNLSKFTSTLANNKEELFGTVDQIEQFTKTFAQSDQTVRDFNDSLASGAQLLAGEREDLAAVLDNLGVAMREVRSFVAENRELLGSNIAGLNRISKTLVKNRAHLDKILKYAPVALDNLALAANAPAGTLDTRAALGQTVDQLTSNPGDLLCTLLGGQICNGPIQELLHKLGIPSAARTAPFGAGDLNVRETTPVDRSLGGLVEVTR